jgi:hypothetical protein
MVQRCMLRYGPVGASLLVLACLSLVWPCVALSANAPVDYSGAYNSHYPQSQRLLNRFLLARSDRKSTSEDLQNILIELASTLGDPCYGVFLYTTDTVTKSE